MLSLHAFAFLVASVILLAAESVLIVRALHAAWSPGGDPTRALDAVWTALPGVLVLALLAYAWLTASAA